MDESGLRQCGIALAVAEILYGVYNSKNGSTDPDHAPFREDFSSSGWDLLLISQCTKFEVSRFTRYDAMNGGAKCRKWCNLGQLGALKVIGNVTIR